MASIGDKNIIVNNLTLKGNFVPEVSNDDQHGFF